MGGNVLAQNSKVIRILHAQITSEALQMMFMAPNHAMGSRAFKSSVMPCFSFMPETRDPQPLLTDRICFCKEIPECSVQNYGIVKHTAMLLQAAMAHSAIFFNVDYVRVGQGYLWDQVIPTLPICPTRSFKYRFH